MLREFAFRPEIERFRDLVYSEYTSCNRSVHVLLQEHSLPQYAFLLNAYREIVTRYLSFTDIHSPVTFLGRLVAALDLSLRHSGLTVADLSGVGFYLLLRSGPDIYLLVSKDAPAFARVDRDLIPIGEEGQRGVDPIGIDAVEAPGLFPQRLSDFLVVYRIRSEIFPSRDIVLGCRQEEKGAILEALLDPTSAGRAPGRQVIVSRFITRQQLVLRLSEDWGQVSEGAGERRAYVGAGRWVQRPRVAVTVGAVFTVIVVGTFWMNGREPGGGGEEEKSRSESTEAVPEPTPGAAPSEADAQARDAPSKRFRLVREWSNTYGNAVTSSPVLFDLGVIFGCRDGRLYALDIEGGKALWRYAASDGVGASPAVYEGDVVCADYSGRVFALDARTGAVRWSRKLPLKVVSSPSVLGGRVLVGCYDGIAYCLSMGDGKIVWKHSTRGRIRGSPAAAGGAFYVTSYDGYLYALSGGTGAVLWKYNVGGHVASSPATDGTIVVVGDPDGTVHALDAAGGKVRWNFKTSRAVNSAPLIDKGRVYVGSNDTHVYCLNSADGALVWKFKTADIVLARPFVYAGVVYVGSYDGNIYGLNAESGELLHSFETGAAVYSSPVADGARVLFGNNKGDFYCLRSDGRSNS